MFRWPRTINAGALFSENKSASLSIARRTFASELVSTLERYGFARLRNYGVQPATVKRLFKLVRLSAL
jgi:isopenicillin N synthase-like dioxygenase